MTALGGPRPRTDRIGAVTITERPELTLATLAVRRGREADLSARAPVALPEVSGVAAGGISAFWTAPGQWFLEAEEAAHPDLAAEVKAAVGDAGSVTEQTDGWAAFDLAAPDPAPLLARLCNVDVATLVPGRVVRTTIGHLGAFLLPFDGGMRLWTARSSAGSFHHALIAAARSIA